MCVCVRVFGSTTVKLQTAAADHRVNGTFAFGGRGLRQICGQGCVLPARGDVPGTRAQGHANAMAWQAPSRAPGPRILLARFAGAGNNISLQHDGPLPRFAVPRACGLRAVCGSV